ncbi:resuscitation-promoting factor [Terrabacter sp. Soil810]|uniref:resuscitation-promoting factor n=1 Tax=Terrabacter sp. Soil810 TaxID=1736418 RepID=UPI00070D8D7F|nr:resuscitation-promoting factor [Terrabacter sp. Soil810]KRF47125.1 transglycosylase [Terrabacter sp. Soil810]
MISRNAKILAAAGAAVVLTGGAVGATQLDKAVNLSVDGTTSSAHVFGSTVGDVLDDQGIAVRPGDVVVPAADAPVSDGDTITVKYARLLTLTVDGKTRQVRTTETTVDGALLALGLRGEGARLSVSRSQTIGRQGLAVSVVTPKAVTVTVDGKTTTKTIAAATVGEALTQLGVRLGKVDKVNPPVTTRLTSGAKVAVQRVQTKDKKVNEAIAFGTTKKKTSDLYTDQTKVSRAGVAGVRTVTVRTTVVDGKVVSTKKLSSKITKAPVDRILLVGTKARPAAAPSTTSTGSTGSTGGSSSGGGINLAHAAMWDSIAQCESTGNWHINTGNGYYGGLQFLTSTWLAYGGGDFASRADLASREQQITVANRVYADNGTSQWGCG